MKKLFLLGISALCLAIFATVAGASNKDFGRLVASSQMKQMAETVGKENYQKLAASVTEKNFTTLVKQFLAERDSAKKLPLACAVMSQTFRDGDPANWEEVDGYMPTDTRLPMQLCAVDALMQAVVALVEEGSEVSLATARYLVERLGASTYGKFYFVTETPEEFRQALDILIQKTFMVPGVWASDKVTGHLPLTPRYCGCVSYDHAVRENMQFFGGLFQVASNGDYAWDRKSGSFYTVGFPFGHRSRRW